MTELHRHHQTAFAHCYQHPITRKVFYVYNDAKGDERLATLSPTGEFYVKCANRLPELKKFYTLVLRNVLIIIHRHSGRMVRLSTDQPTFGLDHTVKEEGDLIHARVEKSLARFEIPVREASELFNSIPMRCGMFSDEAIERIRQDLKIPGDIDSIQIVAPRFVAPGKPDEPVNLSVGYRWDPAFNPGFDHRHEHYATLFRDAVKKLRKSKEQALADTIKAAIDNAIFSNSAINVDGVSLHARAELMQMCSDAAQQVIQDFADGKRTYKEHVNWSN